MLKKAAALDTFNLSKTFRSFIVSKKFTCVLCFCFRVKMTQKSPKCKTASKNFKFKRGFGTVKHGFPLSFLTHNSLIYGSSAVKCNFSGSVEVKKNFRKFYFEKSENCYWVFVNH